MRIAVIGDISGHPTELHGRLPRDLVVGDLVHRGPDSDSETSINSVLLILTIGVTSSSVQYLVHALRRVAADFEREESIAGKARLALRERRVEEITEDLPPLPDFSSFAAAFKPDPAGHGDIRAALYAGYEEADCDYVLLGRASRRLARSIVSMGMDRMQK